MFSTSDSPQKFSIEIQYEPGVIDGLKPGVLPYTVRRDLQTLAMPAPPREEDHRISRSLRGSNIVKVNMRGDEERKALARLTALLERPDADEHVKALKAVKIQSISAPTSREHGESPKKPPTGRSARKTTRPAAFEVINTPKRQKKAHPVVKPGSPSRTTAITPSDRDMDSMSIKSSTPVLAKAQSASLSPSASPVSVPTIPSLYSLRPAIFDNSPTPTSPSVRGRKRKVDDVDNRASEAETEGISELQRALEGEREVRQKAMIEVEGVIKLITTAEQFRAEEMHEHQREKDALVHRHREAQREAEKQVDLVNRLQQEKKAQEESYARLAESLERKSEDRVREIEERCCSAEELSARAIAERLDLERQLAVDRADLGSQLEVERKAHKRTVDEREQLFEKKLRNVEAELLHERRGREGLVTSRLAAVHAEIAAERASSAQLQDEHRDLQSSFSASVQVRDLLRSELEEAKRVRGELQQEVEVERAQRELAEKVLEGVKRECKEPFVVPALLDLFITLHESLDKTKKVTIK